VRQPALFNFEEQRSAFNRGGSDKMSAYFDGIAFNRGGSDKMSAYFDGIGPRLI
jgi:hypothetical protein